MRRMHVDLTDKIKALRKAKQLTQAELDEMVGLPKSSISKIENGKREPTANELVKIANCLGVSLGVFSSTDDVFVFSEEAKVVEALREIPFDDYQRLMKTLEAKVYFASKDVNKEKKEYLQDLVAALSMLSTTDQRPRSHFAERQRIRK